MITVRFRSGEQVPALGQGTWHLGEGEHDRAEEVAALRERIQLEMTLIDTVEMYGEGAAEEVVGEAIKGQRGRVFLVTKVYPHHASRTELPKPAKEVSNICESISSIFIFCIGAAERH